MLKSIRHFFLTASLAIDFVDQVSGIIKLEEDEEITILSAYYKIKETYEERRIKDLINDIDISKQA